MNRLERLFGGGTEARVRYLAGEFQVLSTGDYVRCAVTGTRIELQNLRYWNVELQEGYASPEAAMTRFVESQKT